jgi:hypothetical protein
MRRLLRILLNAATVLSLVLCAMAMAAWVRSYQARDDVVWVRENPRMYLEVGTHRGGLLADLLTPVGTEMEGNRAGWAWTSSSRVSYATTVSPKGTFFNRFGFGFFDYQDRNEWRQLACPYWFLVLLTAILPGARLIKSRRRARRLRMGAGHCHHCGYDCRATPERCPECGTALVVTATTPRARGEG